jgi:plastocyanin
MWKLTHLPAAALLALAVAGCGGGEPASRQDTTSPTSPAPAAGAPAEATARVTIDQFAYNPRELTVTAGTRVTWVNRDDVPHTVTSVEKPRRFGSGTLDTDDQFAHVFTTPGTYEYYCAVHPKMTAKVIVK